MSAYPDRVHPLAAPLRPWISEIRTLSFMPEPSRTLTRLPSGTSALVVCTAHANGLDVVAAGPNTRASYKRSRTIPLYARFTFKPGAARTFFGVALHELADRVISMDELWGPRARQLRDVLAGTHGAPERAVHALAEALIERLRASRVGTDRIALLERAVRAIEAEDGEPEQVPALAARLGISERQLRQLFREEIGISPKRYARIARIRRVIARAGKDGWADLAAEAGFYDQAHLYAEFRELMGVTPRAYLERDLPLASGCGAS